MRFLYVCLILSVGVNSLFAQLSHGGIPSFYSSFLRSSDDLFVEMPAFNPDDLRKEDELNTSEPFRSFRFAQKFHTHLERGKSGLNFTLPDGTKVWQVGIRSQDAYSINVLFSEYHIPEGGKLFLYNLEKTHVLGSFTSDNNSENGLLPVSPIKGDAIIIDPWLGARKCIPSTSRTQTSSKSPA